MPPLAKRGIISFDLASMVGDVEFTPATPLPRHDKSLLERSIGKALLDRLAASEGAAHSDLQSTDRDPPDVTFTYNGVRSGMELTELVPPQRHDKDALLQRIRRGVLDRLQIGEHTRGQVVSITFQNDYARKLRLGPLEGAIAEALRQTFECCNRFKGFEAVPIPEALKGVVQAIHVQTVPLRTPNTIAV